MPNVYFNLTQLSDATVFPDLTAQSFGRWIVVKAVGENTRTNKYGTYRRCFVWLCRCDCGNESPVLADNLMRGLSTSCGCAIGDAARTHGMSTNRLYKAWHNMLSRTRNPNNVSYYLYGARGITVSDEWLDFTVFFSDMGFPPKGYSLDRIDNNGPYSKENCRWASNATQATNKRTNRFITAFGMTLTISQWSQRTGLSTYAIKGRLQLKWKPEDIVSLPHKKSGRPRRLVPPVALIVETGNPRTHVIDNRIPNIPLEPVTYPTFIALE